MSEITAAIVKTLRDRTNAGMMDCKKALAEANGDLEQAETILRKKGITKAGSKADRAANQGVIASYIHMGGTVGVLIEVNCETDFVARNDSFKEFVKDLTLHIAAAAPICVSREQIPAHLIEKERDIAAAQAREQKKPEAIIPKIVEGKIDAYCKSLALLDQPFIKDDKKTIKDLLAAKIAELGENMIIRRFVRYQVGEAEATAPKAAETAA